MKIIAVNLMFFGFLGLAFGFWGLNTPAGQAKFDEMDGMYPFLRALRAGFCLRSVWSC